MNRREFLGQVACAFAAAGLPCRIPPEVVVTSLDQRRVIGWKRLDLLEAEKVALSKVYMRTVILNGGWLQELLTAEDPTSVIARRVAASMEISPDGKTLRFPKLPPWKVTGES